ncbi:MAG: hypothetical protein SOY94_05720, partial [Candidatus Limiplasma sp.]|nr:hypothetical protein [Candidatus Limiplasma sp.]
VTPLKRPGVNPWTPAGRLLAAKPGFARKEKQHNPKRLILPNRKRKAKFSTPERCSQQRQ